MHDFHSSVVISNRLVHQP